MQLGFTTDPFIPYYAVFMDYVKDGRIIAKYTITFRMMMKKNTDKNLL